MPLRLNFTTREMGTVDLKGMSNEKREKVEFEESAEWTHIPLWPVTSQREPAAWKEARSRRCQGPQSVRADRERAFGWRGPVGNGGVSHLQSRGM